MKPLLEARQICKQFAGVTVLKHIDFTLLSGQVHALMGGNGAGKSTTIHMLTTLFPPNDGTVQICNHRLGKDNQEIRKCIGVVPQQNRLDDKLSVRENLLIHGSLYENSRIAL